VNRAERKELEKAGDLADEGRLDEAIARLEVLVASADAEVHDLALNYLADAYAAAGRNGDAEAALQRSIDERGAPNEGIAWQLAVLAPVVRRQGRADDAERIYLRALDLLKPDEPELKRITMRNLACLYWSTGRQDEARGIYAKLPAGDTRFLKDLSGQMKAYLEPEIPV
jgi:tetratricopeptide (TPR) repeat protein